MTSRCRALAVSLLALAALRTVGCRSAAEVRFDVTIPQALVADTAWFEIGAFRGARCAALRPMLPNGIPDGALSRVALRKSERSPPRIGDLPNDAYAFAAVARKDDCSVIGVGCVEANVGDTEAIDVPLSKVESPVGACAKGTSCQAARCVPANDNADPSVGASCSLELLGAGPLPRFTENGSESASPAGMLVSAPAIAPTPSGFVVAYRQLDSSGGTTKLVLLPIDPSGGALSPLRSRLKRCSSAEETDGVGLAMNGADGLVALARAPCDEPPALELLNFKVKEDGIQLGDFWTTASAGKDRIALSPARAAAWRGGTGVIAYTEGGAARLATMFPAQGIKEPKGSFGGAAGMTGAWVVATESMLALLAAGTGATGTGATPDGGVSDAGTGGGGQSLRLVLAQPAGIDVSAVDFATGAPVAPVEIPGTWGSIAATGKRAIVLTDGSGSGRSATYRAYDFPNRQASDTNGITVPGDGKATAGDVAIQGDRAYFAIVKPGSILLSVYANATTSLTPLRQTTFASETRIPSVSNVRDGRVAVAATDRRVAVVWTTATTLAQNDSTGGYAVFACTP